jgi:ATP-dependent Lon protease
VLIPEENVKDLADIPENVKNGMEIIPVKWIDQVLQAALERQPQPLPDEVVSAVPAASAEAAAPAVKH